MSRSARRWSSIVWNCPSATLGERRVLAVGREHPRVVREAGAEAAARAHACPSGRGTACPGWSSGSAGSSALCVRSARFCLPQSTAPAIADRRAGRLRAAGQLPLEAILAASSPDGSLSGRRAGLRAPRGSGRSRPRRPRALGPPAGSHAGSAAGRPCPCRTGRRRTGSASARSAGADSCPVLRAAEGGARSRRRAGVRSRPTSAA